MRYLPLLVVPLLLYNAFAFLIFEDYEADFRQASMWSFALPSGEAFTLTVSATIIVLALLLLAVEVAKTARGGASIVDNVLAAVLFIVFVAEFLIVRQAATATFLLLTAVAFVDLVCGLALSLRPSPSEAIGPPS